MAGTGQYPTILDVASRSSASGEIVRCAEMLSQHLSLYKNMPFEKANERTAHMFVFRTSIPNGSWRMYNMGVPSSKSTTAKARVSLGMLEDYSVVDRALAEHTGNVEKFRRSEDVAFLEGMGQTIEQTLIYGNTVTNPAGFQGLSTFYNTINTNNAQNAANVFNGGGTGTSNTSIWMLGLGPNKIYCVYPEGSAAGLDFEDKGDIRPAYDSLGNQYEAYTAWFRQQIGLVPEDWRFGARVPNIDVTTAGLAGPNALDIFATLAEVAFAFPHLSSETSTITETDDPNGDGAVKPIILWNRTTAHWAQIQAMRNRNTLLQVDEYAGIAIPKWRGIPCMISDQILNTETALT
jgi:hypothetical protein